MNNRFFPTGAKTEEEHEAANLIADLLIARHQKGEIQTAFKEISEKDWNCYLPMARAILDFGRKKNQACANRLHTIIWNELHSKEFTSTEADLALRELNNMANMNANTPVPEVFTRYATKVGYHFRDGWQSLGKAYIQFQAAAKKDAEIIQLVDAEIRKQQSMLGAAVQYLRMK